MFVLSDRYSPSTFGYQGVQGIDFEIIKKMHEQASIISPDITCFLDVDYETVRQRIQQRGEELEKFEGNEEFTRKLIEKYRELAGMAQKGETLFGRITIINGNNSIEEVSREIKKHLKDDLSN